MTGMYEALDACPYVWHHYSNVKILLGGPSQKIDGIFNIWRASRQVCHLMKIGIFSGGKKIKDL